MLGSSASGRPVKPIEGSPSEVVTGLSSYSTNHFHSGFNLAQVGLNGRERVTVIGKMSWQPDALGFLVNTDEGWDMELRRIAPSTDGNAKIARQTEVLREKLGSVLRLVEELGDVPPPMENSHPVTEETIRTLLRSRRNRERFFEPELFADPAWDILLELYASHLGQQRISVTSVCAGAAVPATTALRWISALQARELVERRGDPMDGRRYFLSLTESGLAAMENYFRTIPPGMPVI